MASLALEIGLEKVEMRLDTQIGHLLEPRILEVHVSHSLIGEGNPVIH